jgi:trimethylamine-N-oxide reductase (cytochrome c)
MQHKCIEPLGESKSDYNIFLELSKKLGLSAVFSEGMTELDWCQRIFEGSDAINHISFKDFLKKGYLVIPAEKPELRAPTSYNWFYEGRKKDVPEPHPLPADYSGQWLEGLQTQSGKFEFVPETLKRINDPERPPVNKYIPSWEGTHTDELLDRFPIQLISGHSRYSFHTLGDGKDTVMNDIKDHRVLIDGHYYLECRLNPEEAISRGIPMDGGLVRLFNDRGAVVCFGRPSVRVRKGVVQVYESSAVYDPLGKPGFSTDRGGCINVLTSNRDQIKSASSMGPNSCLIQYESYTLEQVKAEIKEWEMQRAKSA